MKKSIKMLVSAFLALALVITGLLPAGFVPEAAAAGKLTTSVSYLPQGEACVSIEKVNEDDIVYYTTDGSTPDENSYIYKDSLIFASQVLLRVAEFTPEGSRVSGIKKKITPKAGTVQISVLATEDGVKVALSPTLYGAEIHYTTNGTKPDESSPLYTGELFFTENLLLKAVAVCDGYKNSTVVNEFIELQNTVQESGSESSEKADTNSDDGFKEAKEKIKYSFMRYAEKGYTTVTLSKKKTSDTIYYTTDGSAPTKENGKKYEKAVRFTELGTLRAAEYNKKGELVATLKVKVPLKCAPIEAVCTDFVIGTKVIKLSCETEGATIYYTLDGLTPEPGTEDTYIYDGEMRVGTGTTLTAVAIKNGYEKGGTFCCEVSEIEFVLSKFNFGDPTYSEAAVLINSVRGEKGLSPFTLDEKLTKAANVRTRELSVLFEHTRPSGGDYTSAVSSVGAKVRNAGEIIISNCSTPSELINAILNNSDYKQLLFTNRNSYTSIGIGYYKLRNKSYWSILVAQSL